jgi:lysophospholipase L1-like esterase
MRRIALSLGVALLSFAAAVLLAEMVLRIAGFSFSLAPDRVEFGWPDPVTREGLYLSDPDLFWVPKTYYGDLQRLEAERPQILFLGDSCTEFGHYPRLFLERMRSAGGGTGLRGAKLGVGGWSSYQGLQQLKRDVLPLRPRVVTLYFGWNDHWIGFGVEDGDIHWLRTPAFPALARSRVAQLLLKARLAWRSRGGRDRPARVSPEEFRANLQEMARLARANGIVPVFLTAPSSHEPGREPAHLAYRWLRRLGDLVPLHQRYVAIVREVAREEGAVLCDLAARFEALPAEDRRERYFRSDGIHPTPAGDARIAEFLQECFEREPELGAALASSR